VTGHVRRDLHHLPVDVGRLEVLRRPVPEVNEFPRDGRRRAPREGDAVQVLVRCGERAVATFPPLQVELVEADVPGADPFEGVTGRLRTRSLLRRPGHATPDVRQPDEVVPPRVARERLADPLNHTPVIRSPDKNVVITAPPIRC